MYTAFARLVGARLDEVELPLTEYESFGSFFTRRLRAGARTVAGGATVVVAPCDGLVAAAGEATGGRMIQAKGRDYAVADLVVDQDLARALDGGAYVTIYLSVRDYHRVHAPCDGELLGYDYVPGALHPVTTWFSKRVPELFARNERMVLHLRTDLGRVAFVMVGALGVGGVSLAHDGVSSRDYRGAPHEVVSVRYDQPIGFARGDELGRFELGSTVVLLFEPGRAEIGIPAGTPVRFGQALAGVATPEREGASA